MANFTRKKGDILTKENCFYCWRKLTSTEVFINSNYCFVCKLKHDKEIKAVKIPPKK